MKFIPLHEIIVGSYYLFLDLENHIPTGHIYLGEVKEKVDANRWLFTPVNLEFVLNLYTFRKDSGYWNGLVIPLFRTEAHVYERDWGLRYLV